MELCVRDVADCHDHSVRTWSDWSWAEVRADDRLREEDADGCAFHPVPRDEPPRVRGRPRVVVDDLGAVAAAELAPLRRGFEGLVEVDEVAPSAFSLTNEHFNLAVLH